MKRSIIILDTYYPEAIRSMPINPAGTYESELNAILYQSFGTADFYSRNLRTLGWDAEDIITNHDALNSLRKRESQNCDVLFLQDLSIDWWPHVKQFKLIAGQVSCPWPGDDSIRKCDVIFTSFPHYIQRIEALGAKAVYNPLGFDPIVLARVYPPFQERINDVVFIGGIGNPGHWRRGMETLNLVAERVPSFKWWGYGAEYASGPLREKYQGEAWGLDMYRIMLQSKIVLNRHGEVAEGYSNNMRMFEATGCGAVLLTEESLNLSNFFEEFECQSYCSAEDAVTQIETYLKHEALLEIIGRYGHARTMSSHTYFQRMAVISNVLTEMLANV